MLARSIYFNHVIRMMAITRLALVRFQQGATRSNRREQQYLTTLDHSLSACL